ncbi:MAG: hypothetical protein V1780_06680, partial [Chloroflexota bacterium]
NYGQPARNGRQWREDLAISDINRKWLAAVMVLVIVAGAVAVVRLAPPPPQPEPPPPAATGQTPAALPQPQPAGEPAASPAPAAPATPPEPPAVRSVTITDEEVIPLLPISGATLHFLPGNQAQVGHPSVPRLFWPRVNLGATGGRLWLSGIPSWLDLSLIDDNINDYTAWWRPDWQWSFSVAASGPARSIVPQNGITTAAATPTFDWTALAGEPGVKYRLEIATDSTFSAPLVTKDNLTSPGYTLKTALAAGSYYWRVTVAGWLWLVGMPPWLDISRYDPEVSRLPTVVAVETEAGRATLSYLP